MSDNINKYLILREKKYNDGLMIKEVFEFMYYKNLIKEDLNSKLKKLNEYELSGNDIPVDLSHDILYLTSLLGVGR